MATSQFVKYPPSVTASGGNASVGANGAPSQTSSTLVAGQDPSSNQKPIQVDALGNQYVNVPAAVNASGSVTALGVIFTQDCLRLQSASVHLTTLPAGNVVAFEISNDNATWFPCAMMPGGDLTSILTTSASAAGSYTTQLNSRYFRARVSTYTSGTITANAYFKTLGNSPNSVGGYVSALTLDGSGNPVGSTAAGLKVDVSGATQPVSGTVTANAGTNLNTSALALEAGGNLAGLNAKVTTTVNGIKVDGSAVTQPVSGTVVLGAGAAAVGSVSVSNFPATQPVSGTVTANTQGAVTTAAPAYTTGTSQALSLNTAGGLRVDGSGVTQPVSAASLPLPAGAATSALQSTISGQLPATLGQKTSAASLATVLASDQSSIPTKSPVNATPTFSTAAISAVTSVVAPANTVGFLIQGDAGNTANIRFAVGATASATLGITLAPGQDSGFIPSSGTVSIFPVSGTQTYQLQWVSQ